MGREHCALQEWMMGEWSCIDDAKKAACKHTFDIHNKLLLNADYTATDPTTLYHLEIVSQHLCCLCVTWQSNVSPIPCPKPLPSSWGPSEALLQDAAAYEVLADWDASVDESSAREAARCSDHSECDNNDLEDLSHECGEFFDSVEAEDLTDAYQEDDGLYLYLDHGDIADRNGPHTPSPHK